MDTTKTMDIYNKKTQIEKNMLDLLNELEIKIIKIVDNEKLFYFMNILNIIKSNIYEINLLNNEYMLTYIYQIILCKLDK